MMTQTLAILHDAYRELNAKKLFWIVLALSGVVVLAFATLGINAEGLQFLWWTVNIPEINLNTEVMSKEMFYKSMFQNLGIGLWLTWIATVLALVSTASIFPEFISSGSIDLMLSKPIGRFRLFLTKYMAGLLFVALQVLVFSLCSFFVIGIRGGAWEPSLFLAVPVVVLFFSYLFSVCALLGMLTRSTIASILLTILVWFLVSSIGSTENILLDVRIAAEMRVANGTRQVEQLEGRLAGAEDDEARASWRARLEEKQGHLETALGQRRMLTRWHDGFFAGKTILPKTAETVALLDRVLTSDEDLENFVRGQPQRADDSDIYIDQREKGLELQKRIRARSLTWVVGTSLGFEAVMLALAGWIFCRRDF
jgi:ABC-type transport system involved in multi-copper enzyme maturation permease subunit